MHYLCVWILTPKWRFAGNFDDFYACLDDSELIRAKITAETGIDPVTQTPALERGNEARALESTQPNGSTGTPEQPFACSREMYLQFGDRKVKLLRGNINDERSDPRRLAATHEWNHITVSTSVHASLLPEPSNHPACDLIEMQMNHHPWTRPDGSQVYAFSVWGVLLEVITMNKGWKRTLMIANKDELIGEIRFLKKNLYHPFVRSILSLVFPKVRLMNSNMMLEMDKVESLLREKMERMSPARRKEARKILPIIVESMKYTFLVLSSHALNTSSRLHDIRVNTIVALILSSIIFNGVTIFLVWNEFKYFN